MSVIHAGSHRKQLARIHEEDHVFTRGHRTVLYKAVGRRHYVCMWKIFVCVILVAEVVDFLGLPLLGICYLIGRTFKRALTRIIAL